MPSDWDAASYDRVSDPQARWALQIIDRIDGTPSRVLDAGCGSGRVTELLLRRFPDASVVGVDSSASMLDQARQKLASYGDRVELVRADLTRPLPVDGSVDLVFSNAVFHWIADHDALFGALAGVLTAGGQLVAQCGGVGNVRRLLAATEGLAPQPPGRASFATAEETRERLIRAGFTDIDVWLNDDPYRFESREAFEEYLRVVCVRCHLDLLPEHEREPFVRAVADRLPDMTADYVRLNIVARRAG